MSTDVPTTASAGQKRAVHSEGPTSPNAPPMSQ